MCWLKNGGPCPCPFKQVPEEGQEEDQREEGQGEGQREEGQMASAQDGGEAGRGPAGQAA